MAYVPYISSNLWILKTLALHHESFIEPFFTCVTHRCKWMLFGRNQVSLVNKRYGIELPRWMFPKCHRPILPYLMEHCNEGKWLCGAFFESWSYFKQRTVQIIQFLLIATKTNHYIEQKRLSFVSYKISQVPIFGKHLKTVDLRSIALSVLVFTNYPRRHYASNLTCSHLLTFCVKQNLLCKHAHTISA